MYQPLQEEEILKRQKDLEEEKQELQNKKEEYQKDLERLRDAQRKLERDREAMQRHLNKMEDLRLAEVSRDTLKIIIMITRSADPCRETASSVAPQLQGNTVWAWRDSFFALNDTPAWLMFMDAYSRGLNLGPLKSGFKKALGHILTGERRKPNSTVMFLQKI